MNKKGNLVMGIVVIVLLVAVVYGLTLVVGIVNNVNTDFNTYIQEDSNIAQESKDLSTTQNNRFIRFWDSAIIVMFFFLWFGSLVGAAMSGDHPMLFGVFVVALIVVLIISFTLMGSYDDFVSDSTYSSFTTDFPKVNWLMENLVLVILIVGGSIAFVTFSRMGDLI